MAKIGRPTKYNEDLVHEICTRVANGTPLREICREDGMPAWTTFYNWINADKELFERFARARELGTDAIAEDTLAIIDTEPERVEDDKSSRVDSGFVQWQKNRVELRLKLLSKWNPRKYGDRQILAGDKDAPIEVNGVMTLDTLLDTLEKTRQLEDS